MAPLRTAKGHAGAKTGKAKRPADRRTGRATVNNGQGKIRGMVRISERRAEAADRAVPGHWEGDIMFGAGYTAIATLVERRSRFVMLVALAGGHGADSVADALSQVVTTLPDRLRRSLTWDQGKEMAEHARFSIATGVPVYFCDPHSPWQRAATRTRTGCCASTWPGRTDFKTVTQSDLDRIAAELNDRPRQTLKWKSPCQALDEALR
jgi:IS30 family transposase